MRNDARHCKLVVESLENRVLLAAGCSAFGAFVSGVASSFTPPFLGQFASSHAQDPLGDATNYAEYFKDAFKTSRCE